MSLILPISRSPRATAFDTARQRFLAELAQFLAAEVIADDVKRADIEATLSAVRQIAALAGVMTNA